MHSVHVRPRRVTLHLGDPISTEGLNVRQRGELTVKLQAAVARLLDR
jgi:hypothetical protein